MDLIGIFSFANFDRKLTKSGFFNGKMLQNERLKLAYEQSIQACQHHVQRYSTWMNMYAIMTGALLVAFYSVYGDDKSASNVFSKNIENVVCLISANAASADNSLFDDKSCLLLLICVLGFICSLCWWGAVKGHYEWMKSFIQILKFNEKQYFGENGPFVYSKVMAPSDTMPKEGNYLYGFLSTQKITLTFIKFVILAWLICFVSMVAVSPLLILLALILTLFIVFGHCKCIMGKLKYFHSTIYPQEVIVTDLNEQNTK